jgi:hypothetical protein
MGDDGKVADIGDGHMALPETATRSVPALMSFEAMNYSLCEEEL